MKVKWHIFGWFFLLLGCVESEPKLFLQDQQISLSPPQLKTNSLIIDSSITLTADLRLEGVKIFYSKTENPDSSSLLYSAPLQLNEAGTYRFRAFHPDFLPSETVEVQLFEKGVSPDDLKWYTQVSSPYPGLGDSTLINNKRASLSFRDSQWVGFDTVASAQLYWDNRTFVKSLTLGFLVDTKSWIFPPKEITLILNGTDTIHKRNIKTLEDEDLKMEAITIPISKDLDSIKIEVRNLQQLPFWHAGKGNKAWLFMDEWILNE
jgi:hexosaminidase